MKPKNYAIWMQDGQEYFALRWIEGKLVEEGDLAKDLALAIFKKTLESMDTLKWLLEDGGRPKISGSKGEVTK